MLQPVIPPEPHVRQSLEKVEPSLKDVPPLNGSNRNETDANTPSRRPTGPGNGESKVSSAGMHVRRNSDDSPGPMFGTKLRTRSPAHGVDRASSSPRATSINKTQQTALRDNVEQSACGDQDRFA
eukprot:3389463-Rhodomonas_salina.2